MPNSKQTLRIIRQALQEDRADKDITTDILVPQNHISTADILFKESAVICGITVAQQVFQSIDRTILFQIRRRDGQKVKKGTVIASLRGKTCNLLRGERVALNFLGYLSGIATKTADFVHKTTATSARIFDTRKTIPGLRDLQKYAVLCGGGHNHRHNLAEMVLIKDNHRNVCRPESSLTGMIVKVRKATQKPLEIEVENLNDFKEALLASPDIILLDNMNIRQIKKAVLLAKKNRRRIQLEVSGGIRLNNIRTLARTGINRISVGELTHSSRSIDVSMEISHHA